MLVLTDLPWQASVRGLDNSVTFCTLVEHPGGHDGGEFPQYHTYGVADDGSVYYATDYPECSNDTFADEDASDYKEVTSRTEALKVLRERLQIAEEKVAGLRRVVAAFDRDVEFTDYFESEDEESDEDAEESDDE